MRQQKDIFISYRRSGGEWFAYCIYLELVSAGYTVFFDVASLRGGSFEKDIEETIERCKDFILVLPPNALNRCVEAEDLVYKEIKIARDAGKNIIPIMMKGFSMPPKNLFQESFYPERYEDMKYIEGRNGYITEGILNLDGTILHLMKNLLTAVPNVFRQQQKPVSLEKAFARCEMDNNKCKPEYELLPNLSTNEYFVEGSRDKEIAWLSDAIERMQPTFVWGYGGVGKTELVMEFARYQSHFRNVSFTTFSNSIRETIIKMKFIGYAMPDLQELPKEEREVAEEKIYQEKLKLLNAYSEDDILIIDNFEKTDKTLAELKSEKAYKELVGVRMHIIFTTRNRPDKHTEEILPLTKKDLLIMMKHYLGNDCVSEELMLELIDAVDSHTMAVELIAKMMADEFCSVTPKEVLASFTGGKMRELDKTKIDSYKDREYRETTIFEHIKLLFDLSALSKTEVDMLRHAFFISTTGIKTNVFVEIGKDNWRTYFSKKSLLDHIEYEQVLKRLINKGWLRVKNKNIFIHPLVKDVINEEIKIEMDETLANYLINFSAPQYNEYWNSEEVNFDEWQRVERMRAEYMANVFRYFNNENPWHAIGAAVCYERCADLEQAVIYSHYALDIMLQSNTKEDLWALSSLIEMWCPKLIESSWEPDCYYGNELDEDYSHMPDNIQGIFRKIQILAHDLAHDV